MLLALATLLLLGCEAQTGSAPELETAAGDRVATTGNEAAPQVTAESVLTPAPGAPTPPAAPQPGAEAGAPPAPAAKPINEVIPTAAATPLAGPTATLLPAPTVGPTLHAPDTELYFPWVQDGKESGEEVETYESLLFLKYAYPEVFPAIIGFPWLADNITFAEFSVIQRLVLIIESLPPEGRVALAQIIGDSAWLNDGIDDGEDLEFLTIADSGANPSDILQKLQAKALGVQSLEATPTPPPPGHEIFSIMPWTQKSDRNLTELAAMDMLSEIARVNPPMVPTLNSFPWLADKITSDKLDALVAILQLVLGFPPDDGSLAQALSEAPWLQDTLTMNEVFYLVRLAGSSTEPAEIIEGIRNAVIADTPVTTAETSPRPELAPIVPISELGWTRDGLTDLEQLALTDLQTFDRDYPEMAEVILRYSWVADGINADEQLALTYLLTITQGGPLARLLGASLPPHVYQEIVDRLPRLYYLIDGIAPTDRLFLRDVSELPEQSTMIANFIASEPAQDYSAATPTPAPTPSPAPVGGAIDFPWVRDGLTAIEQEVVGYLRSLQNGDEFIAAEVMQAPWLADGVDEGERRLLCLVATHPDPSTGYAIFLTSSPSTGLPACP